ncbi:MAG: 3-hydroxyacyl-CoA dehydrogenase NAD-binding domain-containing protein [Planctomycetota bacterium]
MRPWSSSAMSEPVDAGRAFQLRFEGDVAILEFDDPAREVNLLDRETMKELQIRLESLAQRQSLQGLVVSSGKKDFIAGADVDAFAGVRDAGEGERLSQWGQHVYAILESLSCPTVAAIRGSCLGGGLELALACKLRVASDEPRTKLALPEVQLGIIPGFGGTQRLPRLVGLPAALDLMLTGKSVPAQRAFKMGLVDDVAPSAELMTAARRALGKATEVVARRAKRVPRLARFALAFGPLGQLFIRMARKQTLAATGGHYPAPLRVLDVVAAGLRDGKDRGYAAESQGLGELLVSAESRSLVRVFQLMQRQKKRVGERIEGIGEVRHAGVVGAGVMGSGIAALLATQGVQVRLRDIDWEPLRRALADFAGEVRRKRQQRRLQSHEAMAILDRIRPTVELTGFKRAEVVIEAATENLDLKRRLMAELEKVSGADSLLATNTSSLSLSAVASALARPERLVGLHFFNPVARMPLVEVIQGPETAARVVDRALALALQLGKVPIIVASGPGFLVNRMLAPYLNEAATLVVEGTDPREVDRALKTFGWPMGPFRLLDEVGLDVAHAVSRVMVEGLGERMLGPPLVQRLLESGAAGKKVGRGFYTYRSRRGRLSEELERVLTPLRVRPPQPAAPEEIIDRTVLAMVNEAARCLDDGIVEDEESVDLASVLGLGFPAFCGGVLSYARTRGLPEVVTVLNRWAASRGERFRPADWLARPAAAPCGTELA